MTPEERIARLEGNFELLRTEFRKALDVVENSAGQVEAHKSAVLALLASHPMPEAVRPYFDRYQANLDATANGSSLSEHFVLGAQEAARLLRLALENAEQQRTDPQA